MLKNIAKLNSACREDCEEYEDYATITQ